MTSREIYDATDHISDAAIAESATQIVPAGSVLIVVRSGILVRRLPIALARVPVAMNQDMKAFLPGDLLLPEFLVYAFVAREQEILRHYVKRGATVHSIDLEKLQKMQLPIPPRSEQRRIVEILDKADSLRNVHREADAKAARILPALFIKMFGDPATNPKGWPELPLREVIGAVEAGWSAVSEARTREENEYGVLKVSAVTSGRFLPEEHKAVRAAAVDQPLIVPRRGDLLFSRANTRELVAACCVVAEDHPKLFLPDKIWRVSPKPGHATSMFLRELFWQNGVRNRFRASASGSSGSMLNISQESMLRTLAPIPPFELQEQFSALAWKLTDLADSRRAAGEKIKALWGTLNHRAFSGVLTTGWRADHIKELLPEMEVQARLLNLPHSSFERLAAEV
jgi:type I restriction enzyme S subunit